MHWNRICLPSTSPFFKNNPQNYIWQDNGTTARPTKSKPCLDTRVLKGLYSAPFATTTLDRSAATIGQLNSNRPTLEKGSVVWNISQKYAMYLYSETTTLFTVGYQGANSLNKNTSIFLNHNARCEQTVSSLYPSSFNTPITP